MSSLKGLHPGHHDEHDSCSEKHRRRIFHDSDDERKTASPAVSKFKGDDRKSIGIQKEKPAELFRKDLISAMKLPDSDQLQPEEYFLIADQWKMDWEKGVQVPVNPQFHNSNTKILREKAKSGDFKLLPRKYLHNAQDENYKQGIHELTLMQQLADQVVRYDLDEVDSCWLQRVNDERLELGDYEIQEWIMEKVMEEIENQCHENMQQVIKTAEGCGIEYDENILCDVCQSPDSEDQNEMVFCDNCDICVHQACYGIQKIPEGNWLCRTCALGIKPLCILCPNMGGAMKSTKSGTKWAHVSCSLWIPEVSIGCVEKMEPITKISQIPSSRWALLCTLCREKTGACIQCSVRQCKTAFHVTCAFQNNLEMKTVLDENDEDDVKLKAYCPKHTKKRGGECESPARTPRKDGIGPISPRKELTNEEKDDLRQRKIKQLQNEFYSCVTVKDVAASLQLDEDTIDIIYEYWKLKRRVGGNKPLLTPKHEEEDLLAKQQENSLIARMKMFVQLRQDLERVRNLCYMVSRREKYRRSLYKMKEDIFYSQLEVVEKERMSTRELDQIIQANHGKDFYDDPEHVLRLCDQFHEKCNKAESERQKFVKNKSDSFPNRTPVRNRTPVKKEEVTIRDKCDKIDGELTVKGISPDGTKHQNIPNGISPVKLNSNFSKTKSPAKELSRTPIKEQEIRITPSKKRSPGKCEKVSTGSEEKVPPVTISPDKVPPVKISPGKVSPVKISPGKVSPVKISPGKVPLDKISPEKVPAGKIDRISPVKISPEKVPLVRISPCKIDKVSPVKISPGKVEKVPTVKISPVKVAKGSPVKISPDKIDGITPLKVCTGKDDLSDKTKQSPSTNTPYRTRKKLRNFMRHSPNNLLDTKRSPGVNSLGVTPVKPNLGFLDSQLGTPTSENLHLTIEVSPEHDSLCYSPGGRSDSAEKSKSPKSKSGEKVRHSSEISKLDDFLKAGKRELPMSDIMSLSQSVDADGHRRSSRRLAFLKEDTKPDVCAPPGEPQDSVVPSNDISVDSVPKAPSQDLETQSTTTSLASGEDEEWIIIDSPPSGDESTKRQSPGTAEPKSLNSKLRLKSRLLRKSRGSFRKKIVSNGFHKQAKIDQFLNFKSESANVPVENSLEPDDVLLDPPFSKTPVKCSDKTHVKSSDKTPVKGSDKTPVKGSDKTPVKGSDKTPVKCLDNQSTSSFVSPGRRKTPLRPSSKSNSDNTLGSPVTRGGKRKVEADLESLSSDRIHQSSRESSPDRESRSLRPRRKDTDFVKYDDIKKRKVTRSHKSDVVSTDSENISHSETGSDKSGPVLRKRSRLSDMKDDRSITSSSSRHSLPTYSESKRLLLNLSQS